MLKQDRQAFRKNGMPKFSQDNSKKQQEIIAKYYFRYNFRIAANTHKNIHTRKELQKQGILTLSLWMRKQNCNSLEDKFHAAHLETEIAIMGSGQPWSDTHFIIIGEL